MLDLEIDLRYIRIIFARPTQIKRCILFDLLDLGCRPELNFYFFSHVSTAQTIEAFAIMLHKNTKVS
jgi:hypothetical protein